MRSDKCYAYTWASKTMVRMSCPCSAGCEKKEGEVLAEFKGNRIFYPEEYLDIDEFLSIIFNKGMKI